MKQLFLILRLSALPCFLLSQDADPYSLSDTSTIQKKAFHVNPFVSPIQRLPGFELTMTLKNIRISAFASFKHNWWFSKKDSLNLFLPYASNDSTLFYEVRSYTNQKYLLGFGLQTNFRPTKRQGVSWQIGLNLFTGKYSFQDYYAKVYYSYYRDSITGNVYYEDQYGDPSWEMKDAFAEVLTFSKADMSFRIFGAEPYFSISPPPNSKGITSSIQLGYRFSYHQVKKEYYLDFANVLESPSVDFQKSNITFRMLMVIPILFKTADNSPKKE